MRPIPGVWSTSIGLLAILFIAACVSRAAQVTQVVVGIPSGSIDHFGGLGLGLELFRPLAYDLSDSSSWNVTGGSESYTFSAPSNVATNGSTMTFTLQLPVGSQVFYGADTGTDGQGAASTEDRLSSISPLLIQAQTGSATATATGYFRLTDNSNVQSSPGFSPFATPVGSIIPYQITYTMLGGQTWTSNFDSIQFNYQISGTLDITHALAPGDANGDGKVNFADLVILAQNYGRTGATWFTGDFTGDGVVGFADLVALAQNYGYVRPTFTGAAAEQATVPEPSAGVICTVLLLASIGYRRHSRQ